MAQSLIGLVKDIDRTLKLVLGIWGCLVAPLMIWTGVALMIVATLGIELKLANPVIMGLELFLIGAFWELVIFFTFIDN